MFKLSRVFSQRRLHQSVHLRNKRYRGSIFPQYYRWYASTILAHRMGGFFPKKGTKDKVALSLRSGDNNLSATRTFLSRHVPNINGKKWTTVRDNDDDNATIDRALLERRNERSTLAPPCEHARSTRLDVVRGTSVRVSERLGGSHDGLRLRPSSYCTLCRLSLVLAHEVCTRYDGF